MLDDVVRVEIAEVDMVSPKETDDRVRRVLAESRRKVVRLVDGLFQSIHGDIASVAVKDPVVGEG